MKKTKKNKTIYYKNTFDVVSNIIVDFSSIDRAAPNSAFKESSFKSWKTKMQQTLYQFTKHSEKVAITETI